MWNLSAYHRGMMSGTTPNIDRIANEGMLFMDHCAQASCTAGRAALITGALRPNLGSPEAEAVEGFSDLYRHRRSDDLHKRLDDRRQKLRRRPAIGAFRICRQPPKFAI